MRLCIRACVCMCLFLLCIVYGFLRVRAPLLVVFVVFVFRFRFSVCVIRKLPRRVFRPPWLKPGGVYTRLGLSDNRPRPGKGWLKPTGKLKGRQSGQCFATLHIPRPLMPKVF